MLAAWIGGTARELLHGQGAGPLELLLEQSQLSLDGGLLRKWEGHIRVGQPVAQGDDEVVSKVFLPVVPAHEGLGEDGSALAVRGPLGVQIGRAHV